jgi:hypothetical protein
MTAKKKSTKKGGTKGKAEGSKKGGEVDHAAVAWALANTLFIEPEGAASRKILAAADGLASAIGSTAWDMRAEYLLRTILDEYTRCDFRIDGHDRGLARRAYNNLIRLAVGAEDFAVARRVAELMRGDDKGSAEAVEWFMQLTNDIGVHLESPAFAVPAFVEAARRVKATKPVRRITTANVMLHGAQKAYERLKEIVRRVDAGESLVAVREERQRGLREVSK